MYRAEDNSAYFQGRSDGFSGEVTLRFKFTDAAAWAAYLQGMRDAWGEQRLDLDPEWDSD